MALQAFFCKMNILLAMIAYVPCQTSIPYSENGFMREFYIVFINSRGRYLDNLNNMPTDLDIFRTIYDVYTIFECEMFIKNDCQEFNIISFLYSCRSNFNIS